MKAMKAIIVVTLFVGLAALVGAQQPPAGNPPATQGGRGGGGPVNVSLKGGTNKLHGSLYHYFRNVIAQPTPGTQAAERLRLKKLSTSHP